ncbi:hypothetical protein CISG_09523 [Coccidioides immitis RMSCC 3703]|uniref:Bromo domain-containing protein n=1 Tax=Coccidioides immitis RMSCC 3703 TaxID=454286 RepID=A0A0J8QJ99_COCIT|nr:hypothetical protein CISG_09523 [Coccidioides immitis RMSCC 3703]
MPSLSSYTPFESLLFFQSLAGLDKRPENFSSISDLLRTNPFIQQHAAFDINRLTPQALEELYADLVKGAGGGEISARKSPEQQLLLANGQQDGLGSPPSPKKRRLTPPGGDGESHSTVISGLVSRLYARYKELVTKEIQEEERRYRDLNSELSKIQHEKETESAALPAGAPQVEPQPKPAHLPGDVLQHHVKPPEARVDSQTSCESGNGLGIAIPPRPETNPPIHPTPDSNRQPVQQAAPRVVTQYRFENKTPQSMQAQHQGPQWVNTSQQPAVGIPATATNQAKKGRTPIQPNSQAPAFSGSPSSPHIAPTPAAVITPREQARQPQISSSSRSSPPKPVMQGRIIQPWSIHAPPQPQQVSLYANAPQPTTQAPSTPVQGPQGLPAETPRGLEKAKTDLQSPATGTRSRKTTPARRKGRSNSPLSPSTIQTRRRGRSNTGRDDETESSKIKNELPSTPINDDMDIDRRTSERLTRSSLSVSDDRTRSKRKRAPTDTISAEDGQTSPQHVLCTRNFPRTCGPVMNDIAAHKHASIFAKPLTERDAPGYKDLIYRPQDIKSIKSAIHQGSKAVAAASEALSASGAEDELSGTSKGNGLILKRTAELMPPRGIVNSSQLEKELIRMFANAVMFNPTPESTFGPAFSMRSEFASREQTQALEPEEGGILHDTLEIYEDVERAVSTWRAAERAVDDLGGKGSTSTLRGSTGDGNIEGAEDVK